MPLALFERRFCKVPVEQCLCPCDVGQAEDIIHYVLLCPVYNEIMAKLLIADELKGSCLEKLNYVL